MLKLMQGSEEINSNGGFSFVKKQLDGNAHMKDWDAALAANGQIAPSLEAALLAK